jgi:septum formation protein
MSDLVLASTSLYRRQLLERLGLPFRQVAPDCDEDSLKDSSLSPAELAVSLARAKARSIADAQPQATVIGSDQVCALGNRIFGKPGSVAGACSQLASLCGQEHHLLTAVCIVHDGQDYPLLDTTRIRLRPLDDEAIARYVQRDQPVDCAGAYKLEAGGIGLVESIQSDDHSAVTGLPLIAVGRILQQLGYQSP